MSREDWIGAILLVLILLVLCMIPARSESQSKQAYVICKGRCLESVKFSEHAEMVTPMVDGKADRKKSVIRGEIVNYNPNLETVEMR